MRKLLFYNFIVFALILGISQSSYADCSSVMNGMGGQDVNCPLPLQAVQLNMTPSPAFTTDDPDNLTVPNPGGVDVVSGIAIHTFEGDDTATVGGIIRSGDDSALVMADGADTLTINDGADIMSTGDDAVQLGGGVDIFVMNGGSVVSTDSDAVRTGGSGDTVTINGGLIDGDGISLNTRGGGDFLTINGGTFNGDVFTDGGADTVFLNGGTFVNSGLDTEAGPDTINITTDVSLTNIDCGAANDTLIFSMDVPAGLVAQLTADVNTSAATDSLMINGIQYNWTSCNNRVPNFNGTITTISLAPLSETNEIISNHTVTATVLTDGVPESGFLVSFNILIGPNQGLSDDAVTNANGEATFTYEGSILGTDEIIASVEVQGFGVLRSNSVSKTWILPPRNVPTLSEWGLITMAGLLGIIAFIVMRRRQVNA